MQSREASNLQAERNSKKLSNNAQFKRDDSERTKLACDGSKSRLSHESHAALRTVLHPPTHVAEVAYFTTHFII